MQNPFRFPFQGWLVLQMSLLLVLTWSLRGGGVVGECTESALRAAMNGGSIVTFACDGTITLSNTLTINTNTLIDGSGHQITISGNNSVRVFSVATNVNFTGANLTIANGWSDRGAGVFNDGGVVIVTNCQFIANRAQGAAGGNNSVGQSVSGGALYNCGVVRAYNCTFASNSAAGGAGGPGSGVVPDWSHGMPGGAGGHGDGGAIWNLGILTMAGCLLAGNSASGGAGGLGATGGGVLPGRPGMNGGQGGDGGYGRGGALFNSGFAALVNNTVALNSGAGGQGGGGGDGGPPPNSDYHQGSGGSGGAGGSGEGAAINDLNGHCYLTNCTLALNGATNGLGGTGGSGWGGLAPSGTNGLAAGSLRTIDARLVNTVLSANTPSNCWGALTDAGHNLSSDASCAFTNVGSLNSTDPKLGPLADNGGPTLTMALLPGSPAIDAGDPEAAPSADQRGYVRPAGLAADMGAFESGSTPPVVLTISRSVGTAVDILARGSAGSTCWLLTSTNLSGWRYVATNQFGPDGTALFQEESSGAAQRFYRVSLP